MIAVLERAVADAYAANTSSAPRSEMPEGSRRELVERAKRVLAETFRESLSLPVLAAHVGVSVFHLCRVFRRLTGFTLHGYRNALRLKAALENLSADLTGVALELGFSSHSHFTAAFRKEFGVTPSALRRRSLAVRTNQREGGAVRL